MSLQEEWCQNELIANESSISHRPLEEEYSFYQAVKRGDVEYVRQNCDSKSFASSDGMGVLSQNPITNKKYHFVVTVALITRYCIDGGMELEQAYRLSDFYILKMDHLNSIDDIVALHKNMVLDFTGKMLLLQKQSILSKPVVLCLDYIYSHIHDRITIQQLADHTHISTSYLSKLFKKELGVSVSDYIRDKKIEHAQNLIKYSNYSFIEIANYLSFSSQSHFIQIFEKHVGMTPKKYRDQHFRNSW